jgi:hypothetical protein
MFEVLNVLIRELKSSYLAQKIWIFPKFLAIKNLDLDPDPFPDSPKNLDTDPYSMKMDPNTD